jgi:exonuclease III
MRVLSWNVRVSNETDVEATIDTWLKDLRPEAVFLQEATGRWRALSRAARANGYRHFQGVEGQAAGVAELIRNDVPIYRSRSLAMRRWWVGPIHLWRQKPRRYRAYKVGIGTRVVRLMNVHFPTGGPDDPAVRESLRRIRRWMRRGRSSVPAIAVGDTNMGERALRTWLTGPVGRGAVVVAGHRADNLVARGAHGTSETLGKHGSDHEAVLYTLTIGA